MNPKNFILLKDINLTKYLGFVAHKFTLKKELWDRQLCSEILKRGIRGLQCCMWEEKAIFVDFKSSKYYCYDDYQRLDKCDDYLQSSDEILNKMNKRLLKIEKMLILIQERDHYFNNNKKKIKITESEKESIQKRYFKN